MVRTKQTKYKPGRTQIPLRQAIFYSIQVKNQKKRDRPLSYKEGIINAIEKLDDPYGSSMIMIRKVMKSELSTNKKWKNTIFLSSLKSLVKSGVLIQVKNSYKFSPTSKREKVRKSEAKKTTSTTKTEVTRQKKPVLKSKQKSTHKSAQDTKTEVKVVSQKKSSPEKKQGKKIDTVQNVQDTKTEVKVVSQKKSSPEKKQGTKIDTIQNVQETKIEVKVVSQKKSSPEKKQGTKIDTFQNVESLKIEDICEISYKEKIIQTIKSLKNYSGSSIISIKKFMLSELVSTKKWIDFMFLSALKALVKAGDLIRIKNLYKLSDKNERSENQQSEAVDITSSLTPSASKRKTSPKKARKNVSKRRSTPRKKT